MQGPEPEKTVFFETQSDPTGKARLAPVDPALPVAVSCLARGYARTQQRFDSPPSEVRCALSRLSGMEGKVVDEDGKPLSGATLTLRPDGLSVQSGADGAFSLRDLTAGERKLLVAAPRFKAAQCEVTVGVAEQKKLDPIELHPAGAVAGRVVDGVSHEAIRGAVVSVVDPPGFGAATTGSDGAFSLPAGADDGLHLEVTAEGYPTTPVEVRREQQNPAAEPLEVDLFPGGRIEATVWDEEADAPCLGCMVTLFSSADKVAPLTTDRSGKALSPPLAKGQYQAALSVVQSLGSVVQVHGGGDTRWVTVEPGKIATVSFGERRPVVEIRLRPPLPEGWSLWTRGSASAQLAAPRPDGSFAVHKRRGEPLALSLAGPAGLSIRLTTLPAEFDDPAIELPLPAGSVGGQLLRNKEILPLSRVSLLAADGTEAAHGTTDETGAFLLPYLPPGAYALVAGGHPVQSLTLSTGRALDLGPIATP